MATRGLFRGSAIAVAALAAALTAAAPASADVTGTAFGNRAPWAALVNVTPASGWEQPGFDDSSWNQDQPPFGSNGPDCIGIFPSANTGFPESGHVYARKSFTLPAGAHSLHLDGTIDNEADVWVNGHSIGHAFDGFCHTHGISMSVPDADLNPGGANVVSVHAWDDGGTTFFDMGATYQAPAVTVSVPSGQSLEATGPSGAVATFSASADSVADGALTPTCTPASGSTFPLGTTHVTCSATDSQGNTDSATFDVTVSDTTPPALTVPGDMSLNATSASGAVATFSASANDLVDGSVPVTCTPGSGSTFSIGDTTVNCSATDSAGNAQTASFTVHVASADKQLQALGTFVIGIGPGGSLTATVQAIQSALASGNTQAACGALTALANKAAAQSGKSLTTAQADEIEAAAARIAAVAGC